METFVKGTKENLAIDVKDRAGTVTTLTGTTPIYDVYDTNGAVIVNDAAASNVGLTAYCLIDTTLALMIPGEYKAYLKFTPGGAEVPDKGPVWFRVVDK